MGEDRQWALDLRGWDEQGLFEGERNGAGPPQAVLKTARSLLLVGSNPTPSALARRLTSDDASDAVSAG